jgi:peptide/nickel transport system permease protein
MGGSFPADSEAGVNQRSTKPKTRGFGVLQFVRRFPQLAIGLVIITVFVTVGITAPILAPGGYDVQALSDRLQPPIWAGGSTEYLLGTDQFGRDVLTRIAYGAQVSLLVGVFAVVISGLIGSFIGLISGYAGGNVDAFLMRIVDIQLAFPYILLAIVIVAFWGGGLLTVIIALSLSGWMGFARTVRSYVLGLKEAEYVVASRAVGATTGRIMLRHIMPNMLGPMLVFTTFQLPTRILGEATLSFLGLGVQPPTPTWGNMLAANRDFMISHPWLVILPGISLAIVAFGANMLGDGLRDYLDPRTRRRL